MRSLALRLPIHSTVALMLPIQASLKEAKLELETSIQSSARIQK
jgi:hypothetical protein